MKTIYWIGGVVVASIIGYIVWKMLEGGGETSYSAPSFNEGAPMGNASLPASAALAFASRTASGKVLTPTFNKPKPASIGLPSSKKTQLSTGLGGKKGFMR